MSETDIKFKGVSKIAHDGLVDVLLSVLWLTCDSWNISVLVDLGSWKRDSDNRSLDSETWYQ